MKGFPGDMELRLGPDGYVLFLAKDRPHSCPTEFAAALQTLADEDDAG